MSFKYINDVYNNNYERIEIVTNNYISSTADIAKKKEFLILKREYNKIQKISDYKTIQKLIYKDKKKTEIISFELSRILTVANERGLHLDQINDIQSILNSCKQMNDISDDLYIKAINIIIKIELSLGMKIGLFNELCNLFEKELHRIESQTTVETSKKNR